MNIKSAVPVQYYCVQYIDINIFQNILKYIDHPHLHGQHIARVS